jgi:predicted glycosyltransferase
MKVVLYCQHVLGIGHFFRSMELCRALYGHEVIFLAGGARVDAPVPDHVRMVSLPGLMMDSDFKRMFSTDPGIPVDQVKERRKRFLWDVMAGERPDVLIVELYPFGRKAFRFELDPVLMGIRDGALPPCRVICSLRDILVEKTEVDAYEQRVVETLNLGFDAVWIHADPRLVRLNETFSRVNAIAVPVVYTGFITPKPPPDARARIFGMLGIPEHARLIVASAGGGKVGGPLLTAAAAAFRRLGGNGRLEVFTGPFMPAESVRDLEAFSGGDIHMSEFTTDFISFLAAADLSVSMAGYNTCMNVMAAGCPALLWPFSQNREQRLRAERLARFGDIHVLADSELAPRRLADLMAAGLVREKRRKASRDASRETTIDLEGAQTSARWLASYMNR